MGCNPFWSDSIDFNENYVASVLVALMRGVTGLLMDDYRKNYIWHGYGWTQIRVGVMTFSTDTQLVFNLNQYRTRPDAAAAVRLIPYRTGRTNTADAIRFAKDNMFTTG